MSRTGTTVLLAAALAFAPAPPARAAESSASCQNTIASLPATAAGGGTWCLGQNLTTTIATGAAIDVTGNNTVIDCNGFGIDGSAAGLSTQADGILSSGKNNVTIRNCRIKGFRFGINLGGPYSSGPYYVEDNVLEANTATAIRIQGYGTVVRGNRVHATGGSTAIGYAVGIAAAFADDVSDNTVVDVVAAAGANGNAQGIYAYAVQEGSTITGNRVRGVVGDGTGTTYGILIEQGNASSVRNNDVVGTTGSGIRCDGQRVRVRNNVVSGFPAALDNCVSAGGNVVKP